MPSRGVLYYSDGRLNAEMLSICQRYVAQSCLPVTSVTLKPMNFGRNISLPLEPCYESMYLQILIGLEAMTEDIVYFCEHDVLYHPGHFDFVPSETDTYYYNGNYWYVRMSDGFAIHYNVSPLSGLCAYREPLTAHFRERVELISKRGFGYDIGFEPMTHHRIQWRNWYQFEVFQPEFPNVDLCHGGNLTQKRWNIDRFRRKPKLWEESNVQRIPGWPDLPEIIAPFFPLDKHGLRREKVPVRAEDIVNVYG